MSTATQISANQANAQISTGPRTDAGKAISSLNNLRLGFRSQTVLLPGDDPAEYQALLDELTTHFVPAERTGRHSDGRCERSEMDVTEVRFVREMADAEWRLRRVREHMQAALTRHIATLAERHPDAPPLELQSRAIETLAETGCSYGTWLRYERKFENQYDRAYRDWIRHQNRHRAVADREANSMMQAALTPRSQKLASTVQTAESSVPSAQAATRAVVVRDSSKTRSTVQIASNASCPCGSGDKYKRCCGRNAPPLLGRAA